VQEAQRQTHSVCPGIPQVKLRFGTASAPAPITGRWQVNVVRDAKTGKVNNLRKKWDRAKITLADFLRSDARNLIFLRILGRGRLFRGGSSVIAGGVHDRIGSRGRGSSRKLHARNRERRMKFNGSFSVEG
jgi:hypothetical protein